MTQQENIESHITGHYNSMIEGRLEGDEIKELFHAVNTDVWLETLQLFLGKTTLSELGK